MFLNCFCLFPFWENLRNWHVIWSLRMATLFVPSSYWHEGWHEPFSTHSCWNVFWDLYGISMIASLFGLTSIRCWRVAKNQRTSSPWSASFLKALWAHQFVTLIPSYSLLFQLLLFLQDSFLTLKLSGCLLSFLWAVPQSSGKGLVGCPFGGYRFLDWLWVLFRSLPPPFVSGFISTFSFMTLWRLLTTPVVSGLLFAEDTLTDGFSSALRCGRSVYPSRLFWICNLHTLGRSASSPKNHSRDEIGLCAVII